ncbi:MAG: hypothetical protein VXY07_10620 [Planctomycetota bacterium]|nr:hypothetical protein [Planctomycetota bacterium]
MTKLRVEPSAHTDGRLRFLTVMIAISSMTHMISFQWWTELLTGQIVLGTTLLIFLFPGSTIALAVFLASSIFHWFTLVPRVPNHIFFEMLVHLTLLSSLGLSLLKSRQQNASETSGGRSSSFANTAFNLARPYMITELIILYLFTVIHKLNYDFFDPEVSCAVSMHHDVAASVPGIPEGPWTWWPTIIGTILIELAIPMLFIARRTRSFGLFLGIGFHLFLALHPHGGIYSFTGLLFTLYFLLLPDSAEDWLTSRLAKIPRLGRIGFKCVVLTGFFLTVYLQTVAGREGKPFEDLNAIGFMAWLPLALLIAGVYILALIFGPRNEHDAKVSSDRSNNLTEPKLGRLLWIFPILVLINGSSPYLGLKTTTAFSMFSNLRTEGGQSNHFFLSNIGLFKYQEDLVEVVDSNDAQFWSLINSGDLIPWFEFRRMASMSERDDAAITCIRNGKHLVLKRDDPSDESQEAFTPHPWLADKFLHFRSIRPFDQPQKCCW